MQFYEIPKVIFDKIHDAIESLPSPVMTDLRSMQFLVWDSRYSKTQSPPLPLLDEKQVHGFYSPVSDPDLLTGILWFTSRRADDFMNVHSYVKLLDTLVERNVIRKVDDNAPVRLTLAISRKIHRAVRETFR